jgi:hypothetical protein
MQGAPGRVSLGLKWQKPKFKKTSLAFEREKPAKKRKPQQAETTATEITNKRRPRAY